MNSIRRQLLLALLGTVTAAVLLGAGVVYRLARAEADELFDYQLRQMALSLRDQSFQGPFAPPPGNEEDFDFVIQVWDFAGVRVYYSHPHRLVPGRVISGYATVDTPDGPWRVFATRLHDQTIQVSQPMSARNEMAFQAASRVVLPFLALLPVLSLTIWWLVGRGLAPLDRLARAVADRTPEALGPLPEDRAPEETLPIVHALNGLLARLGGALAAQRALVADAAHELRTPIAAVQLQAQLIERAASEEERQAALSDLQAGVRRAGRTVRQLLALARQDDAADKLLAPVKLAELCRQVVTELLPLAAAKDIDLGLEAADEAATVRGETEGLRVLLANLVENAVRYTPAGGAVDVSAGLSGGRPYLAVADTGPGIPSQERARVFDRFYRAESAGEPGSGLGLAIVKAIADRHGATASLGDRPGGGLLARVIFPPGEPASGRDTGGRLGEPANSPAG